MVALTRLFEAPHWQTIEMVMEDLTFTEQVEAFQYSSILITQYGTAAHNMIFLKPGSVLVLIMQPGWCDWHWTYTDQARLLGIHVLLYCQPPGLEVLLRQRLEGEERYR